MGSYRKRRNRPRTRSQASKRYAYNRLGDHHYEVSAKPSLECLGFVSEVAPGQWVASPINEDGYVGGFHATRREAATALWAHKYGEVQDG